MAPQPDEIRPGVYDWSTVHKPSGSLFEPTQQDAAKLSEFKLSKAQVEQFWRDGFLLNVPMLTHEQCDKVLQDYKYLLDPESRHPGHDMLYEYHSNQSGDPNNVLMHCLGHWRLTKNFHDLVFLPQVTVPCSQLLVKGEERPVRFFHDQLFAKPAQHGGNVAWHQDYSYWTRTSPCMHVTVHIALDDQTIENGTLQYIPGSHRWLRDGKPLPILDFNFKDMEGIKSILTEEELASFKPVPSCLKKGQASFHHSLAVHGSYPNRSNMPRRSAVLNYFGDGVYHNAPDDGQGDNYKHGSLLVKPGTNLELFKNSCIPGGAKLDGQFFPLVYDPEWCKQ